MRHGAKSSRCRAPAALAGKVGVVSLLDSPQAAGDLFRGCRHAAGRSKRLRVSRHPGPVLRWDVLGRHAGRQHRAGGGANVQVDAGRLALDMYPVQGVADHRALGDRPCVRTGGIAECSVGLPVSAAFTQSRARPRADSRPKKNRHAEQPLVWESFPQQRRPWDFLSRIILRSQ